MNTLVTVGIGLVLTLAIYSYVWRDNFFYRLALHIFIGATTAYAAVIAITQVLLPVYRQVIVVVTTPTDTLQKAVVALWLVPVLLALTMLFKLWGRSSWLGNAATATFVGIGAAVALVGAVLGTLLPQMATAGTPYVTLQTNNWNVVVVVITLFLTICTLLYFQFTMGWLNIKGEVEQPWWQKYLGGYIGQAVITITFGVIFAGVLSTSITLLTGRVNYLIDAVSALMGK